MICYIIFLSLAHLCLSQIGHSPIQPQIVNVKISPIIKQIASKHIFSAQYPFLGYQIAGNIFETNDGLLNEQIHDKNFYSPSKSCKFNHSELKLQQVSEIELQDHLTIQTYFVCQFRKSIYLVINDDSKSSSTDNYSQSLVQYEFNQTSFKLKSNKKSLELTKLGLLNGQNGVLMKMSNGSIIMTDAYSVSVIDPQTYDHWQLSLNNSQLKGVQGNLLQLDIMESSQKGSIQICILTRSFLRIYILNTLQKRLTLKKQYAPPSGKTFTSSLMEADNHYFLTQKQLIIHRKQKDNTFKMDSIELQSQDCRQLSKYESTIHMICTQSSRNYVAEFYYNSSFVYRNQALRLNRYYNSIDDVKLLFRFGSDQNPKLLIAGDYDLMFTSFAINRQILLESQKDQKINMYQALGVEDIESVQSFSTANKTFGIGIGTDYITSFNIVESPSSIQCMLERKDNHLRWNLLVQINTTSCLANGDIQQLQSICRTLIPYSLYVSLFEFDSGRELTINVGVYALLIIVGVVIIGCALKCKKLFKKGKQEVLKKIQELKKNKKMKPI